MLYLLLHWFLAIPVWDRYLLPLVPLTAVWIVILAARPFAQLRFWLKVGLGVVLLGLLLFSALNARHGRYPLGSTPHSDQGAAAIAAHLADVPTGTVLYDHWYSWQWRYHLLNSNVFVSWFPNPEHLTADLAVFGAEGRYLVLPNSAVAQPVIRALESARFQLQPVANEGEISLYQLQEQ